jgi:hypothetical protein
MELEDIHNIVAELDENVSKESATIGLYQYGGPDESNMVGTRNGYLRLGIEFLKAAATPADEGSSATVVDVVLGYLLADDSTIFFDTFELAEELPYRESEDGWGDKFFIYSIKAVLISVPILALVGLVTIIQMLIW